MAARTLYDKLWDSHLVHEAEDGNALIYIDRHFVIEVTSPQAYEGLRLAGRRPWRPGSIVATADQRWITLSIPPLVYHKSQVHRIRMCR